MIPLDGDLIDKDVVVIEDEPAVGIKGGVQHTEIFEMNRPPEDEEEFIAWYDDQWRSIDTLENFKVTINSDTDPKLVTVEYIID